MTEQAIYRILDASANRVLEGLRTAEDFTRFVLNAPLLTESCKQLRHRFVETMKSIDRSKLIAARDVGNDVGTSLSTEQEWKRSTPDSVASAAMARVQQALRSLEEYGKIICIVAAQQLEQLRYDSYRLGQQLELATSKQARLSNARLYVLVDFSTTLAPTVDHWLLRIQAMVEQGVNIIQIRDKQSSDRELWERSRLASQLIRANRGPGNCQLIINDRVDIAMAVDADGVHVGQDELPVVEARRLMGASKLVGLSTHCMDQAHEAVAWGADYIGCGPTFSSQTKSFKEFAGLPFLAAVAQQLEIPAFAIGGISASNVHQVIQTGISRIAVSNSVWGANDCSLASGQLLQMLKKGSGLFDFPDM